MNFTLEPHYNFSGFHLGSAHEPPPVPYHFDVRRDRAPVPRIQNVAPSRHALRAPLFVNSFLPGRLHLGNR